MNHTAPLAVMLVAGLAAAATIAATSIKPAKTKRTLNEGTISASAVRTMHAAIRRDCRLGTSNQTSITITTRCGLTGATHKTIANADHRLDTVAAFIQLLAQATNVHVKRARVTIVTITPYAIQ